MAVRDIPPPFSSPPLPLPPPHPSSPQNHPLSLGHLFALSIVCLVLLIIICTIIRKSLSHSNNSATEPAPHIRIPADTGTRTGLSQQVINSISKFNYKKGDGLIQATECSVCLSEFRNNDPLKLLPNCRHAFHCHCIDPWLKSNLSCPVCRTRIVSAEHGGSSSTDPNYRSGGVVSDQSFVPVDVGDLDAEDRRMDIEAVKSRSPSP
ncbi:RING-H2 finger protein ATL54-like [Magnolia sinica]|uniref:RING-H2 finger protein ATL54-like n=1 Tax=Magnolia sinica TaxID=86752 RepID=UPI00265A968B|nr:RING-H2 finger protein ATL54-like [Magnolia sinica]